MSLDIAERKVFPTGRSVLSEANMRVILGMLSVASGLAVWWAATTLGWVNTMLLPSPGDVVAATVEMVRDGTLFYDVAVSLARAMGGFLLAAVIAVPLGLLVGRSKIASALVEPWMELLRPVPPIAFLPLVVLWFGIGEFSKLVVVCYGALFPILLNTVHGATNIDNNLLRAACALGASQRQIFRLVVLPSALPNILTGLRLGAGMAIFVLVAAELLGSASGLGHLIMDSREHFFTDRVMVGIIALGLTGYLINRGLLWCEQHLLRWRVQ